jgi:hypothetical protein
VLFGTRIQRDVGNTMRDLVNGMAGATAFVVADRVMRRDRGSEPERTLAS